MFDLPDTVYAIQHLAFEDLGAWEDVLYEQGLRVRYFEAGVENLEKAFAHEGLVIILGGPIGVYEITDYPFLQQEIDLLKVRLEKNYQPLVFVWVHSSLLMPWVPKSMPAIPKKLAGVRSVWQMPSIIHWRH